LISKFVAIVTNQEQLNNIYNPIKGITVIVIDRKVGVKRI